MPKGIPTTKPTADAGAPRKITLTLRPADYDALAELAGEQYRTPELQASWLLAKVLSEAGRTPPTPAMGPTHAQRIIDRAAEAKGNGH